MTKAKKATKKPQPKRTVKVGRDASTGRFITVDKAKRRQKTAVVETIKHY
ncbi:hypothetical protein [Grimontia indica]|nr:hypothetical protein [Grimontia indica]